MENLYLLLITNRASNVVEDLETLRLLSKVVPDIAGAVNTLNEERISDKCFDLIFAFDEVRQTDYQYSFLLESSKFELHATNFDYINCVCFYLGCLNTCPTCIINFHLYMLYCHHNTTGDHSWWLS